MTYEETIELEKNIIIKNDADELYSRFKKYVKLDVGKFDHKNNRFAVEKDSCNAAYLSIGADNFVYQCRFLHETYNCEITPSAIFGYIKDKYRGLGYFRAWVGLLERKAINK